MEVQKIFESDGTWWVNTCRYPLVDATTNCRFEPNVPVKAKKTSWIEAQADVIKPATVAEAVPIAAPKPAETSPAEAPTVEAKTPTEGAQQPEVPPAAKKAEPAKK